MSLEEVISYDGSEIVVRDEKERPKVLAIFKSGYVKCLKESATLSNPLLSTQENSKFLEIDLNRLLPRPLGALETSDSKTPGSARTPPGYCYLNRKYNIPTMSSTSMTMTAAAILMARIMRRTP